MDDVIKDKMDILEAMRDQAKTSQNKGRPTLAVYFCHEAHLLAGSLVLMDALPQSAYTDAMLKEAELLIELLANGTATEFAHDHALALIRGAIYLSEDDPTTRGRALTFEGIVLKYDGRTRAACIKLRAGASLLNMTGAVDHERFALRTLLEIEPSFKRRWRIRRRIHRSLRLVPIVAFGN